MTDRVRVLRVLEYVGTRDFVESSLRRRTVRGCYEVTAGVSRGSFIQEAILGDFPEFCNVEYPLTKTYALDELLDWIGKFNRTLDRIMSSPECSEDSYTEVGDIQRQWESFCIEHDIAQDQEEQPR